MKKLFTLVTILMMAVNMNASKVVTRKFQVTLADGRTVTAQTRGDENCHYTITNTNEIITYDNGTWRVTTEEERNKIFRNVEESSNKRTALTKTGITATRVFPHVGTPKALVIMINLSDATFTYTKEDIDSLLNARTYSTSQSSFKSYGSAAQYFSDCSGGKFRPQFDVYGPYTLDHKTEYYGSGDDNMNLFIPDACKAANAAGVDFSQYDADNDGYVDLVCVMFAGYGQNWDTGQYSYLLYPKSGSISSSDTFNGKKLWRYEISSELVGYPGVEAEQGWSKPILNGIGVFVHEMSHTMGLADFYPTTSWSDVTYYDNQSLEFWDLMDGGENVSNGYYPTPYTAWERELFGWETIDTLTTPSDVKLTCLLNGGKALRVMNDNDATENEYYILETIPAGSSYGWYRKMPGEGLVVTHVNYDARYFSIPNCPNNVHGQPRITLLTADDNMYSSYRVDLDESSTNYISNTDYLKDLCGDPYPGLTGNHELTNWKAYTGTVDKPLTDIQYANGVATFKFMGGTPTVIEEIQKNEPSNGMIYTLDGISRGNDASTLPHGIYIRNGKKFVK